MTSVEPYQTSIPSGTALLGDLVDVTVDQVLLSGRRPVVAPDAPVEGYGAATWHAFAAMLVDRVAELEAENEALRAGAMHPTARDLLDRFLERLDRALPTRSPQAEAASPVEPAESHVLTESHEPTLTFETAEPVDLNEEPAPVDVVADAVDGFDDDMAASIAGAAEGVDFWDEANSPHGLIGRVRRSLKRRSSARRSRAAQAAGADATESSAIDSDADAPEHIAQAA